MAEYVRPEEYYPELRLLEEKLTPKVIIDKRTFERPRLELQGTIGEKTFTPAGSR
jgi:hypothetical protein